MRAWRFSRRLAQVGELLAIALRQAERGTDHETETEPADVRCTKIT